MPRAPKNIESFGPEIFEALLEGSKREIVLELPYKKAVAFRQRANSLRVAMRHAKHEKYTVISGTNLRILWGKNAGYDDVPEKRSSQGVRAPVNSTVPSKLIISPADAEFTEALRKAGVALRPLGSDTETLHTETSKAPVEDILEQFLKGEPSNVK